MYKPSFFHNLVQSASRLVLSSSRSKGKYLERCLKLSLFECLYWVSAYRNWRTFRRFGGALAET